MNKDFQDKFIDGKLASEDWKCLFLITLTMFILLSGFLLYHEPSKAINCNPDYCYDDFCVILKKDK